jgi:predicted phosphodiesterase
MAKYLYATDFHNDLAAWAWLKKAAPSFTATIYGGDFISANIFSLPAADLIRIRSKYLSEFPTAFYAAIGNHDMDETITDGGQGWWLHSLAEKHQHIHAAGVHILPCGWRLQIVDFADFIDVTGENGGPGTILLNHVPPSSPCAWQHGVDFGDELLLQDMSRSGPALGLFGHVHGPDKWNTRIGRTLVVNPGVSTYRGIPAHCVLDTSKLTITRVANGTEDRVRI